MCGSNDGRKESEAGRESRRGAGGGKGGGVSRGEKTECAQAGKRRRKRGIGKRKKSE